MFIAESVVRPKVITRLNVMVIFGINQNNNSREFSRKTERFAVYMYVRLSKFKQRSWHIKLSISCNFSKVN